MELKPGYKQTEVGVIPEDWEVQPLLKAVHIANGQVSPKQKPYKSMTLVAPDHIESSTGRLLSKKTAADHGAMCGKYIFDSGDIIYSTIRPYLRKAILADFLGLCSADMYPLKPAPWVSGGYILAVILGHRFTRYAESVSVRSGMPTINRSEMADFAIAVPPLPEQHAIASVLADIDRLTRDLELLIAKKRNIKQATMQELLTGRRRLPGFEGEWEMTTVKDVVSRHFCGPSPTCEERNIEGDHEWGVLKTTAITWEKGWSWNAHKLLPPSYWGKTDIELRKGDVLVTKAGPRHRVGVSAWVDHVPSRIVPSGKMIALRPIPMKAEPLMLAAAIASRETQIFLDQRTTGMAESQVNFENSVLLSAPISLPSIDEQSAISGICGDFDRELRDLGKKIANLRRIKEGMIQQLFTGKIRLQ